MDHGVNVGLASLERQASFLHSVLEGLPGYLDALILLHRPTGGHGGSMALGLRVALLYWLAATALPVTVVGRLTHCLVQLKHTHTRGLFLDTSADIHAIGISEKLGFCIFRTEFFKN